VWAQRFKLKPRFVRFLDVLNRIYTDTPFLEAFKKAPAYLQFFKEFLSKKGDPEGVSMAPIAEACGAILQRRSPSKLQDPGNLSVRCCIGDVQIERTLYDLGASMSLTPLFLYKKLKLLDLRPTTMVITLADSSIRRLVGILKDVPF